MTRGKVVLVPFPFDDFSTTKVRTALCLTEPVGPYRHVVLAFITSQIPSDLLESDVVIDSRREDFAVTGLRVTSTIRLHRLMTVPQPSSSASWENYRPNDKPKSLRNCGNCSA